MLNSNLKQLLTEYELKRTNQLKQASLRKQEIYSRNPRLQEIDDELNSFTFKTAKAILQTNNKELLKELDYKKEELNSERQEIFNKLNISQSYFLPKYDCEICKDSGYITINNKTEMCNCLKQKLFDIEYNKLNTYDIKKETFTSFRLDLYSNECNPQKYEFSISPRENIVNIKSLCEKFISSFDDSNQKNLLFTGNSGLGKTFISNCIANELLAKNKTVLYQTAPIMLDSIIDARMR